MKSYKLLKDLPDALSGATFNYDPLKNAYVCSGCGVHREYSKSTVEQKPDWFQKITQKPPIGLIPLWVHNEHRQTEIEAAISRYNLASKEIPEEWKSELAEIESYFILRRSENSKKRFSSSQNLTGTNCKICNQFIPLVSLNNTPQFCDTCIEDLKMMRGMYISGKQRTCQHIWTTNYKQENL